MKAFPPEGRRDWEGHCSESVLLGECSPWRALSQRVHPMLREQVARGQDRRPHAGADGSKQKVQKGRLTVTDLDPQRSQLLKIVFGVETQRQATGFVRPHNVTGAADVEITRGWTTGGSR